MSDLDYEDMYNDKPADETSIGIVRRAFERVFGSDVGEGVTSSALSQDTVNVQSRVFIGDIKAKRNAYVVNVFPASADVAIGNMDIKNNAEVVNLFLDDATLNRLFPPKDSNQEVAEANEDSGLSEPINLDKRNED